MLSPQARRNIVRIIPFGVIWLLFSLVYTQLEKGLIGNLGYYPATGNPYSFASNLVITPAAAMVSGLFIGAIEILYLSKLFTRRKFMQKIFYKSVIYLVIIFLFLIVLTVVANMAGMHASLFNAGVWVNVRAFFLSYAFLSVAIYIASIIGVSQFYNEVSENMGHGVLMNFFTGRYHRPKEEERIFMFLDMTASTSIAEQLGHLRYFDLLHDYYEDLSDPVIRYLGEIYQYVGDEIVISWTLGRGTRDNNCIRCFFAMQAAVRKQKARYESRYGVIPGFRAGLHFGKVTTGEIGALKKEIIFTGDVLNTTSRIQGLTKHHGVEILVSDVLVSKLPPDPAFEVERFGETELRGRDERIEVSTIRLQQA